MENASEYYEGAFSVQTPPAKIGGEGVNPVTNTNTIERDRQALAELIGRILAAYWLKLNKQDQPEYHKTDDQLPHDK